MLLPNQAKPVIRVVNTTAVAKGVVHQSTEACRECVADCRIWSDVPSTCLSYCKRLGDC